MLADELAPPRQILLRGAAAAWRPALEAQMAARDALYVLPDEALPQALMAPGVSGAQVCEGARCLPTFEHIDPLLQFLQQVSNN